MKKYLSLFLSLLFLLSLIPVNAAGTQKGKISVITDTKEFSRGKTFVAEVELNRNPGFLSFRTEITFDPLVLTVQSVENLSGFPGFHYEQKENSIILRYKKDGAGDLTATGKLIKINFQIKSDAIFGDSAISPVISEDLYDVQNSAGKSVSFETSPLPIFLPCPHENRVESLVLEATFEEAGEKRLTCQNCGDIATESILPVLSAKDGSVSAALNPGEYQNSDSKAVSVLFDEDSPEKTLAKETFSDTLLTTFQIKFTKNGEDFSPENLSKINLTTQLDLSGSLSLYLLEGESSKRLEVSVEDNTLIFNYHPGTYALVSRTPEEPQIPATTTTNTTVITTTVPQSTKNPEEQERNKELLLISGGFAVLILCGTGAVLVLRKKSEF